MYVCMDSKVPLIVNNTGLKIVHEGDFKTISLFDVMIMLFTQVPHPGSMAEQWITDRQHLTVPTTLQFHSHSEILKSGSRYVSYNHKHGVLIMCD